jgi:hypothetical protein
MHSERLNGPVEMENKRNQGRGMLTKSIAYQSQEVEGKHQILEALATAVHFRAVTHFVA